MEVYILKNNAIFSGSGSTFFLKAGSGSEALPVANAINFKEESLKSHLFYADLIAISSEPGYAGG
jgi:hypothetical protein